ncbi:MAG: NADH:ubiquinone reductase (Na(+)-transporting) subunit A [Planctomycetota bacterium]|nr:MAG: NADH:ubiquinone reductase (Na(+)-transporting) subunit A [Planctomycetota bacterium]
MAVYKIKKGLDLPIHGALENHSLVDGPAVDRVALLPQESWGIKVQMLAQEGDKVQIGSPLYRDRRDPEVVFTSPGAGTLEAVNRGAKRVVLSVVVKLDGSEDAAAFDKLDPATADREALVKLLCASGLWPNLRQRPFDKVAPSAETPRSIFVTAMDTHPLAPSPKEMLAGREEAFKTGLTALTKLSGGATFLCTKAGEDWNALSVDGVAQHGFSGPHPAGNAGVHINALDPVNMERKVWHIDYQGVAEIGEFLMSGVVPTERRVAVVGPAAEKCAIYKTRRGATTTAFTSVCAPKGVRFVAGSLLSGATADPGSAKGYIGRYTHQLSLVDDAPEREFLGWVKPVGSRWSLTNTYFAKFVKKKFRIDTDINGGLRAIVPLGNYEKVMPMDILPTHLIKSIAANDLETAEKLGVLELAEEDLALCQYVCPSKIDITDMLRAMLTRIEKEG